MKVAIAGYGAEGESSYRYYRDRGDDVTIVTTKVADQFPIPPGAQTIIADDAFEQLEDFDLVIRTPPMRPDTIHTRGKIWSQTNEFLAQCPALIIGVTGTKGKGTTCSLIASILRQAGKTVHLVGNIGVPPLSILKTITSDDVVVFEMSSFQLWDLERSPHVAVVLMMEPDHLDVHHDLAEYIAAKSHIVMNQHDDDIVIYHPSNSLTAQVVAHSSGMKRRYAVPEDGQVYVKSNTFFIQETPLCATSSLQIVGTFNLDNACAAISAAFQITDVTPFIENGLSSFAGLPHRLKLVRECDGIRYYDNSIATTPGSAIAAVQSFDVPSVIILGGSDKGASYDEVVEACRQRGTKVVAIGQTGEKIAQLCQREGVTVRRVHGLMDEAVKVARELAPQGSVVILSPASASFDQYKSYSDRGDQFITAVEAL